MKTKFLTFAAFVAMMASCSSENDFIPQDEGKPQPITVTASVTNLITRAGYETPTDGTAVLPDKFYLSITQDANDSDSKYNYSNIEMTKGSDNTYTCTPTLLWKNEEPSLIAATAYTINTGTSAAFSIQEDQSNADNVLASDLLGAKLGENGITIGSNNNINVSFSHLLCKLDVTYTWGSEFTTENKSITKVLYSGFGKDVTVVPAECTVEKGQTTTNITAYLNEAKNGSEAIFAPYAADAPKITIYVMVDGEERIFEAKVTNPTGGYTSGTRYTMDVQIGGTRVQSVKPTIASGWGDATNGNMATE